MQDTDHSKIQNLRRLIRLKRVDWILMALFFPGSLLLGIWVDERLCIGVAIISMFSMVALGLIEQQIPCPRCGKYFYSRMTKGGFLFWTSLATRCLNCKFSLFSKDSIDVDDGDEGKSDTPKR
jgi:hypothetical protein